MSYGNTMEMEMEMAKLPKCKLPQRKFRFPTTCSVCARECQYFYYGVACCDGCKHFFRRAVILKRNFSCKKREKCDITKGEKCRSCRFNKCILVGMNARTVRGAEDSNSIREMMEYFEEKRRTIGGDRDISPPAAAETSTTYVVPKAEPMPFDDHCHSWKLQICMSESMDLYSLNYLMAVEKFARRIRDSVTPIPERHYQPQTCSSLATLLRRKENLLSESDQFKIGGTPPCLPPNIVALIRRHGVFTCRPLYLALDMLMSVEIAKTMPFFHKLDIQDQACLMSNVGMPIMVLNNAYYSYLLGGKTLTVPNGATPIVLFTGEKYANDKNVMNLVSKVMTELMVPFNRVQISEEEFVLIRAIIYANMVTNGLSPEAQEILLEEAQKYSKMLMRMLQDRHGPIGGARKYAELLQLVEFCYNNAHHHVEFINYMVNVHEKIQFDVIMPPALAQLCIKGNVGLPELAQL